MTARAMADDPVPDPFVAVAVDSPAAMARLGGRLAGRLRKGDVVALDGDLGAGKTTFARGLVRALTGADTTVPSPTFTLVQIYELPDFELWHCDLYRLSGPDETIELGLEDAFADGVALIEWPDRLAGRMPAGRLRVAFSFGAGEDERVVAFEGDRAWAERLAGIADDVA